MVDVANVHLGMRRRTLSSQLYEILEKKILEGELAPGAPISEESLAETYGVSRSPAREALAELERVGLAVRTGMRDRMVTIPSLEMISEKFELWWIVDVGRTYLASLSATASDIDELRRCIDRMDRAVKKNERKRYKAACKSFHMKIRHGCTNSCVNQIGGDCDVYLNWFENLYDRTPEPSQIVVEEHTRILDAFERKDLACLSESIRNHIHRQRDHVLDHFRQLDASERARPKRPALNLVSDN